jgi:predicted dienelactone hydrolase
MWQSGKVRALLFVLVLGGCTPAYKVGLTTRAFIPAGDYDWRGSQTHALVTNIWYPAVMDAQEQDVGLPPGLYAVWNAGRAASDAQPFNPRSLLSDPRVASDPRAKQLLNADPKQLLNAEASFKRSFPLIVLSHGDGSAGLLLAWLGEALARNGFVVAAVNHPADNAMEPVTLEGYGLRWKRAVDLTAVIDGILADPMFAELIDRKRIGAAGHSMGGYSVIELAGGRTDLQGFGLYCASGHPEVCTPPPDRVEYVTYMLQVAQDPSINPMLAQALGHAGDSYLDGRVRAVIAMAPPFGYSFATASLSAISIPFKVIVGDADAVAPGEWNAQYYVQNINSGKQHPNATLDVLTGGVGHFTFLDLPTEFGKQVLPPELTTELPGVDRAATHEQVVASALKFFCESLKVDSLWVNCRER